MPLKTVVSFQENDTAIDFRQLYLLEKRKARQERSLNKVVRGETAKEKQPVDKALSDEIIKREKHGDGFSINDLREQNTNVVIEKVMADSLDPKFKLGQLKHVSSLHGIKYIHYIPEFIHESYCKYLLEWLDNLPRHHVSKEPRSIVYEKMSSSDREKLHDSHIGKWTKLVHSNRNVAIFCSTGCRKLPSCLQTLVDILVNAQVFPESHKPNHILINEYQPDAGIIPHTDGPSYFNRTATISIGGDVLFKFKKSRNSSGNDELNPVRYQSENMVPFSLEVKLSGKGSLIVFSDSAYSDYLHFIEEGVSCEKSSDLCVNLESGINVDRGHRLSLTFRHKYEV